MNRAVIRSFAFLGLIIALGCGGGDSPAEPTGTTATATPTPAPTPEPTPEPAATGCSLEPQAECGAPQSAPGIFGCCDTNVGTDDVYGHQVVSAMEEVMKEPGFLNAEGKVIDEDEFVRAETGGVFPKEVNRGSPRLVASLRAVGGCCATGDAPHLRLRLGGCAKPWARSWHC